MDDEETDYKCLCSVVEANGINPDGELCPDLREIAAMDTDLTSKVQTLRERLADNAAEMRRSNVR